MVATAADDALADEEKEALLRRAEVALQGLCSSFAEEASRQLERIEAALDRLAGDAGMPAGKGRDEPFETIFEAAHEIKGQAGSFGYDLLTHVCDSLCHAIEGCKAVPDEAVDMIRYHVVAARLILDEKIKGDGGALGVTLLSELRLLETIFETAGDSAA